MYLCIYVYVCICMYIYISYQGKKLQDSPENKTYWTLKWRWMEDSLFFFRTGWPYSWVWLKAEGRFFQRTQKQVEFYILQGSWNYRPKQCTEGIPSKLPHIWSCLHCLIPMKIGNWMTPHFNLVLSRSTGLKNGETPQLRKEKKWRKICPWIWWKSYHFLRCRFPWITLFFHQFHSGQNGRIFHQPRFFVKFLGDFPSEKLAFWGRVRSLNFIKICFVFSKRSFTLQIYGIQFFHPPNLFTAGWNKRQT